MRSDICLKPSEVEAYNELLNRLDKVFSDKNSAFADGLTAISKDIEKGNISSPEELVPRMKKLLLKAPAAFSAAANAYNLSKAMFSDDPVLNTTKELCKMGGSAVGTALGAGLATALGTTMTTPLGAIAIVGLVALGSFFGSEGAEKIIDSILDNLCVDPNVPRISISSPTVLESDNYAVFNISLAIPLEIDLELDVKTGNGTAKAGKDFEAVNDKIVIKAGETSYQYKVKIIDDDIRENTEYFTLKAQSTNLLDPNDFGYYGIGIANIKDDDEDVLEVQVQDATCIETDGKIEFTITLNKALEKELKLKVHTVGETATADEDFEDKSGTTITIPPNTTTYKYTIPVASDGIYEGKEQFGLFLVNDGKYEGKDVKKSDVFAMATGTIIDFPKEECPKNSVPNFGFSFDEPRNYFPSYSGGGNSGGGWGGGIGGGWSGSSITYVPTAPTKPSLPHIPEYECHYEPDLNSVLKVKLPSKAQSSNSKTILASSMSVINSLNLISSKDLKSNNNNKQTTLSRPNDTCNDDTCYANKEDKIYFDMNGDGFKERMLEWLKDDEAILVNDINNNGLVDNGLEIVGNHYNYTNSPDSFSLLKEFDTNKDGVIDDKDDHNLALWIDANQNGITDEGELIYLKDANSPIRQIELNPLDTLLSGYDKNHDFKIDKNDGIYNYIYYEENSDNSVNLYIYGDENIKEYLNGYDKNLTVNTDKGIKQVRNIKFYKDIDELDLNDTVNGTSLNDHIIGNNTSNKLYGNAGNDIIEGYDGDDILDGGEGSDKLIGGKGNDILIGGRGNDYLEGGANNDTYIFKKGDGVDVIYDESGYDVVVFEEGITKEDLVINSNGVDLNIAVKSNSKGYLSNQIIIKNFYSPSNMIELVKFSDGSFLSPNDLISMISTNSNDQIYGTYLDETIDALNGDDKVYAGGGNDIIIGNKGDDMLYGGSGNDTYIYTKGDGRDTIFDSSGNDTLILKNISKNDVKFIKNKDSLTLYMDEKNSITIENYFHSSNKIETIKFDDSNLVLEENDIINEFITDGDDIIIGTSKNDILNGLGGNDTINGLGGNDTLIGGNGNDKLYGGSGNDILIGGSGDDYLSGGSGDDIYEYNLNDGNDTIYDSNGNDTLKFGSGINRENISFKKYRNDLSITIKDTNETIKITNFFTKENTIETFKFSDETVLTNDEISAMFSIGMSEKDTIYSSKNATLKGEKGDDIYVYQRGDGKVIVDDSFIENNIVINSGNDTLRLVDIRQNDVKFTSYGNDLIIFIKDNSGEINNENAVIIKDWKDPLKGIENIEFNDGTISVDKTKSYPYASGFKYPSSTHFIYGSEDNIITGQSYNPNIIDAGAGNDIINAGYKNDILIGGKGADILNGGDGDDIYVYNLGDGQDTIYDTGGNDAIKFGDGISQNDILIRVVDFNLYIGIKEDGVKFSDLEDRITIRDWMKNPNRIEKFIFQDGSMLSYNEIIAKAGTDENDIINTFPGNDDVINALGGNDIINSNDGDDIIDGGAGDDIINGGDGNDTYIFKPNMGRDQITDTSGIDRIKVVGALTINDVSYAKVDDDLVLYIKEPGQNELNFNNGMVLKDWFKSLSNRIEFIEFEDGRVIKPEDIIPFTNQDDNLTFGDEDNIINALGGNDIIYAGGGNDIIDGGSGNDILYGGSGNDIIDGGSGNDILYGGSGDDTYLFGRGSGIDIINEYDNSGNYGGNDTLEFKEGITPDDLVIMYDTKKNSNSYDLIVGIKEKGKSSIYDLKDRVTLINWRYEPNSSYFIENFKFSDGTIWNYKDIQSHIFTDGDDTIKGFYYGNKDNILTGGKGNDRLEGYGSNDTYIFNRGDEKDTIYDTGGNDTLKFGEGISREDVVFWSEGNNLIFDLGNGDMVTVINHSNTASNSIEKIELNNGYYIDKNSLDVAISEMKLKSFDNGIVLNRENILKNGALKDVISSSWKKDNDFTPPLVLDLNSNNTTSINLNNSYAYFDYDNDGVREKTAWIEKGDALLAVDLNNNGLIDNGSEIFGNYFKLQNGEFAKDGYEALAEFDSNKDGKIDKHDDHFSDLLVWKDSNQNGISEDGELVSLKSLGITEIKLPKNKNKSVLENGNVISNSSTFIQNGKEKTMNDVWFKIDLNEAKSDISNDILYDNDFEDSKIDNTLHVDKIKILSQAGIKEIILRSGYTGISINGTSAITSANNGEIDFENVWYRSDNTDTIYDDELNSYISGSGTVRGLDDAMKDNDTLKNSVDEYKNSLDLAFDDLNSNMDNILKNWALNDDFMSNISSTPPIVLDLNQNGITSTKLENSDAYFDYQNNGRRYKTSWIEKEDSLLGIDINGDGVINNAYELFGTFSKLKDGSYAKDGYEALKEFDTNGDGVIDQNDENFEKLVAWQDKNGDGKSEKDEVKSLKDLGISSISLNISDEIKEENGNKITASSTFIKDDKEYVMRDIWFNVSSKQSIAVSDLSDSDEKKISVVEAFRGAKLTTFQRSNPYEILKALKEYENIKYSTISKIISKELFGKEMPTCHIMYQALNQKLNRIIANESNPNEIALSINLLAASLKRDYNFAIHKVGKNTLSNPIIKKLLEKTGIKFSFNENGEIEGVIGKNYFGTKDSDNFNFSKNSEGVIVNSKSGNDLIIGSSYNDELNGGLGNDIIYAGDGIDVLRGAQGDDLLIGGDKSTIYEYYLGDGHDTIVDEGGRDILAFSYLDIENLSIEKDGNNMKILVENPYKKDKIIGSITIIDGFTSGKIEEYYFKDRAYSFDEMFKTVSSNSTYYFNSGDGIVSIDDKGGVDKLIFGKGVNFKNIIVIKKENDLEIALNLPNRNYDELLDKLRIKNFFTQTGRIESFIFDNGVILNHEEILSNLKEIKDDKFIMGDDNDNVLNGTDNANIINGKKGNDILNGGFGDDNYIYEKDSGKDIINDTGGNDKLVFGLGITRKDLISKEVGGDLVIALKEEGVSFDELKNSITIKNWKNKDNKIESVMYDNGIVYNIDTLLNTAPTLLSKSSTYTLKNTDTVTGNIGAGDIDGDTLSYKVISNLNNSTINIDKEGNFIYKTGKTVKDTILVEVSDGALSITKELNFNNLGYVIDTNDNITIEDNKLISNSLEFNADIKDVDFLKDKDNLVIKSPSSSLTLKDYFINDKHQIPVINFKDTSLDINSPLYPTKKWWQINPSIKLDNKGVIISYEDNAVLKASSKDDTIISLNSNADIKSFDKDDFIYAGGKNTIINSGDGNDTVIAKEEGNKIYLGDGDDYILSGLNAYINSGDGNDTLLMLGSNSKAYLEDGNDKAFISSSNSFIDAGNGDDTLITKGDNNTLIGSNGNDTYIIGKDANNTIIRDKEYVNLIDGGNDTLILNDIDKSSVEFKLGGSFNKDLIINYSNSHSKDIKTLTIQNQTNKYSAIENINLDGTMLGAETINKIIQDLNSYSDDKGLSLDSFIKAQDKDMLQIYQG
ncbi:calcium-binding protein [Campylobacter ureolyticus]|uniref:calcium-binding protein n=1 Tax=Campylobacter ureolyticus TaxID=827 RepID=UPI0022B38BE1|nr:calcium-binding protein [Campylobacter ureolyticus]MCZ6158758.1 hypothetical protein [Campylobacter ureolyticus]